MIKNCRRTPFSETLRDSGTRGYRAFGAIYFASRHVNACALVVKLVDVL